MHTPLDGLCCCKRAQSIDRLEQARRRDLQRVPGETSQNPIAVDLAPDSEGGGEGAGAGGFCATVTGARSAIAVASTTKMRMRWLIDRFLGRKHEMPKILGRMAVQVKAPDSNNATAWTLRCLGGLW